MSADERSLIRYIRQRELRRTKCFTCACALCTDPTEKDRCGGFLRCASCPAGWLRWTALPYGDELGKPVCDEGADWQCGRCGARTTHADVLAWDTALRERMGAAVEDPNQEELENGGTFAGEGDRREIGHGGSGGGRTGTAPASHVEVRLLNGCSTRPLCAAPLHASAQHGASFLLAQVRLRALLNEALVRCHPNHAIVLQLRLLLVALGFPTEAEGGGAGVGAGAGGGGAVPNNARANGTNRANEGGGTHGADSSANEKAVRVRRKLSAAEDALAVARRLLPPLDVQLGDLYFQIGLCRHSLAQELLHGGTPARREAEALLRSAAEAMLQSVRHFAATLTGGDAAAPAVAARQFAALSIGSIRKLTRRAGNEQTGASAALRAMR